MSINLSTDIHFVNKRSVTTSEVWREVTTRKITNCLLLYTLLFHVLSKSMSSEQILLSKHLRAKMTSPFPIANGSSFDNERMLTENIVALLSSARTAERRHIAALQSAEAKLTVYCIPNILISTDSNRCSRKMCRQGMTLGEANWQARHLAVISVTVSFFKVYTERNIHNYDIR